jgi:hypothetical protein
MRGFGVAPELFQGEAVQHAYMRMQRCSACPACMPVATLQGMCSLSLCLWQHACYLTFIECGTADRSGLAMTFVLGEQRVEECWCSFTTGRPKEPGGGRACPHGGRGCWGRFGTHGA